MSESNIVTRKRPLPSGITVTTVSRVQRPPKVRSLNIVINSSSLFTQLELACEEEIKNEGITFEDIDDDESTRSQPVARCSTPVIFERNSTSCPVTPAFWIEEDDSKLFQTTIATPPWGEVETDELPALSWTESYEELYDLFGANKNVKRRRSSRVDATKVGDLFE